MLTLLLAASGPALAQVVNGDVETGDLTGWTDLSIEDQGGPIPAMPRDLGGRGELPKRGDHAGAHELQPVPARVPIELAMVPLGMPGMTAYFGLLEVGLPSEGDTVLVSGPIVVTWTFDPEQTVDRRERCTG